MAAVASPRRRAHPGLAGRRWSSVLLLFGACLLPSSLFSLSAVQLPTLHIKVTLNGSPVPNHALLISDNPTTAAPRRTVTAIDGSAEIHLKPGSYTIESEKAITIAGKSYQWSQEVSVASGRDAAIELTEGNALVEAASGSDADASALTMQWQGSVFGVWGELAHGSGFLVAAGGLLLTSQRILGTATAVPVDLASGRRVLATVVAADPEKGIAALAVGPLLAGAERPAPMKLGGAVAVGDEVMTIGVPLLQQKLATSGAVRRVSPHAIEIDADVARHSTGGPLLAKNGSVVGITIRDEDGEGGAIPIDDARAVIAAALRKIGAAPASPPPLSAIEPATPATKAALTEAVRPRAGSLSAYHFEFADFDVSLITPIMTFGIKYAAEQMRARDAGALHSGAPPEALRPLEKFENWQDYVDLYLPVLLVRATPKFVEGFWPLLGRNAARTQGIELPPLKHPKVAFGELDLFCGDAVKAPIHRLKIEQRLPMKKEQFETIDEGLNVYDVAAIGDGCPDVRVGVRAATAEARLDVRPIDPRTIQQLRADFAALGISPRGEAR